MEIRGYYIYSHLSLVTWHLSLVIPPYPPYQTFKGLRPLRLHVADFQWGFKSLTENVFNFEF